MSLLRSYRIVSLAMFLVCAGVLGFSILYLQNVLYLDPCPMCILQRMAFMLTGLVALAAAIHGPARAGRRVYGGLVALSGMGGAGVALRHSWLQWFPPDTSRCVGSDLEYMINTFPLAEALPKIFAGSGECSEVKWTFLYLSIPEWASVWFVLFALIGLVALVRPDRFGR
jgi:disulfide bond formation protein DsbB